MLKESNFGYFSACPVLQLSASLVAASHCSLVWGYNVSACGSYVSSFSSGCMRVLGDECSVWSFAGHGRFLAAYEVRALLVRSGSFVWVASSGGVVWVGLGWSQPSAFSGLSVRFYPF